MTHEEKERQAIRSIQIEYGIYNDSLDFADAILQKLSELRKQSEDLVEQIVEIFGFNNWHDHFSGIWEQQFKDVATEIANLAPFQVNAELLEALKGIERCCDNQNPSHEHIWRIAYGAIQNYESKILESSKTCEQ